MGLKLPARPDIWGITLGLAAWIGFIPVANLMMAIGSEGAYEAWVFLLLFFVVPALGLSYSISSIRYKKGRMVLALLGIGLSFLFLMVMTLITFLLFTEGA